MVNLVDIDGTNDDLVSHSESSDTLFENNNFASPNQTNCTNASEIHSLMNETNSGDDSTGKNISLYL